MNLPKFPKITFEDWLEDRLTGKEYTFMGENDLAMILHFASKDPDTLTQEDYQRIRQCQNETYDMALVMTLNFMKEIFLFSSGKSTNREDYLKLEIEKIEKLLKENIDHYKTVLTGGKDFAHIKGQTYKRVKDKFDKRNQGTLSGIDILESKLYPYSKNVKYLEWLKQEMESHQAPPVTINPIHIKDIIEDLSLYISGQENYLTAILNHKETGHKIHFQGTQKKLALSFRTYLEVNRWIDGSKTDLTNWLCDNFNYLDNDRQSKSLSYDTIYSYLTKEQYR